MSWLEGFHPDQSMWPYERLRGWGPGDYACTCTDCGANYLGAKRSSQCYPCAEKFVPPPRPETLEEKCDRLASELAKVRGELAKSGPSCDRCQSAHCCSVVGTPPGCVADPDGSLPLWMPWTNEDVRKIDEVRWAEIDRLRGDLARTKRNHLRRMEDASRRAQEKANKRINERLSARGITLYSATADAQRERLDKFWRLRQRISAALAALEGGAK